MKSRFAQLLRRLAAKIEPEFVREISVDWKRDLPPYVNIEFLDCPEKRVNGWVVADPALDEMAGR